MRDLGTCKEIDIVESLTSSGGVYATGQVSIGIQGIGSDFSLCHSWYDDSK